VARKMGIRTELLPVASIGLGSNAVSPLEMASAYATLAAGGVYSEPMAIKKVVLADGTVDTDSGWGRPKRKRVLRDGVAYEVTRILQQNITSGTGTGANYGDPSAAGKTGTTDNSADAWFAGYTPRASTVVWVGYPNAQISMTSVHGIVVAGGTFPATIWNLFMSRALAGAPQLSWRQPRNPVEWGAFTGEYQFYGEPVEPEKPTQDDKKKKNDKKQQDDKPSDEPTTTETPPTTTEGR
jgi:penicillin-binding protein 1A